MVSITSVIETRETNSKDGICDDNNCINFGICFSRLYHFYYRTKLQL